jgi:CheY-like chemotaxis protein
MADILIIDDDEMMVEIISELLADEGYTVRAAADGVLGLEEVSRRAPDLILLDMNMPVLDGYAVATRLRDAPELRKPLIVAVTGDTTAAATEAILACGCTAIVPKPLDAEQLIACVADLLASRG